MVEIKANWGRARKQYGPQATDLVVSAQKNMQVDVSLHILILNDKLITILSYIHVYCIKKYR
jgi:hypothetical protein